MINATEALVNIKRVVDYESLARLGTGFADVWN